MSDLSTKSLSPDKTDGQDILLIRMSVLSVSGRTTLAVHGPSRYPFVWECLKIGRAVPAWAAEDRALH
jgi:hypothetical protein